MTTREAFVIGARAWRNEAMLATHRNLCPNCHDLANPLCSLGSILLDAANRSKLILMKAAEELKVEDLDDEPL